MKATIKTDKASSVFWEGKFYDTGRELDLPFSEVFRLTRMHDVATKYEPMSYDPELWKNDKFINFFGDIDLRSGFGNVSYYLIKESVGELKIASAGKTYGVRDQSIFATRNRPMNQAGAMVWHDQPKEQWLYSPFKKNIAIVPWETTQIPRSWVGKLNCFDALLVPCKQNIECFRNSGVKIPIELIHWGIDPQQFYPLERPASPTFTFGHMGALSLRKGTDLLVEAFMEEFPTEQDVKLICKTSMNTYPFMVKDPRIEVQVGEVSNEDLLKDFFKKVDCFVFPTRGEGFGLTPLEAMATGIPSIVTGWAGPMEYMKPEVGWTIDYKIAPAQSFTEVVYKEDCGDWTEPDKMHLRSLMRHAYQNREEVKAKGLAAAKYVQEEWLWSGKINMYHEALAKHL
jgi:glycosyltransferase involved in cell wall biosynthesis